MAKIVERARIIRTEQMTIATSSTENLVRVEVLQREDSALVRSPRNGAPDLQ